MTERLYYTDAYLRSFEAHVTDRSSDGLRIYLDRSAFYPTSGGQPFDAGLIHGISVVDVVDEDDRVAHLLGAPLPSDVTRVDGVVDWSRRFDHMQQHTGQHLLSALFHDRFGWPTVSVHFGAESSTIDVTATTFEPDMLREAERMANEIVSDNREVSVSFEDADSVKGLRKPSDRAGTLRIVTIDSVDRSACGGTHVRRTGEIGAVLLRRSERAKGSVRVEFLCGQRSVNRARADMEILSRAALALTAAPDEVGHLVETQTRQLRDMEKERRRLENELAVHTARELWNSTRVDSDGLRRVRVARDGGAVKESESLAQALVANPKTIVIVTSTTPLGVLFATSQDSGVDAGQTLRAALAAVSGRGGGSPRVAQGSVPTADALALVSRTLEGNL